MIHSKLITWRSDPAAPRLINPILAKPGDRPAHKYACALSLAEALSCRSALAAATDELLTTPNTPAADSPALAPARKLVPSPRPLKSKTKPSKHK